MEPKKTFLVLLLVLASLLQSNMALAKGEAACLASRDRSTQVKTRVLNSQAELDTASGIVKGLRNKFCSFSSPTHFGMIDLDTLTSRNSSIAATYLLKGLDLAELEKLIPEGFQGNPGTLFCQALAGSSISRYTSGGFMTPGGEDEVCVFGDNSKISIWVLVYVSEDPNYLSMRQAVKSEPLSIALPYLAP